MNPVGTDGRTPACKWEGRWILHMIDMWSRYTVSVLINRKRPSDIIDSMMTHWIAKFGIMKSVLTDNGGKFNSEEMRAVASILNIRVCTTAGESPFQNGLCERVHSVTDMMLTKLEDEQRQILRHSYAGQTWLLIVFRCGMVLVATN